MAELPSDRSGWRALLRRIARATRDSERAEEHLHTAFVRLSEYARKHPVENPTGFLVRTAVNASADARRLHDNRADLRVDVLGLIGTPDDHPLQDEVIAARIRLKKVQASLDQLTPRTRQVFLMHRIEGLRYREIAAKLGITLSAVEKHIAKAAFHILDQAKD